MVEREAEAEVIERCRQGDMDAFHRLFELHQHRVYSIALHFTGEEGQARDATQQVFLKLFTVIRQFRREAEFSTWLYRIVANVCADEMRRRRRLVPLGPAGESDLPAAPGSLEANMRRRQVSESVRRAIAELSQGPLRGRIPIPLELGRRFFFISRR